MVDSNDPTIHLIRVTIRLVSGVNAGECSVCSFKDSGSVVGSAGTIDFGTNLDVSGISGGIVTNNDGINTATLNADTLSVSVRCYHQLVFYQCYWTDTLLKTC